ncbi:MAG: MFS transporter, partial [Anaerovoracaceae bacterium]
KLLGKVSPRTGIMISGALLFCGFFGVSCLSPDAPEMSLKLLYVLYGVLCGGGVGISYNIIISSVNKWFPDKQGLSSGIMLMGFGFGGIILGSLVSGLIGGFGLFLTFRILAISVVILLFVGSFFIRVPKAVTAKQVAEGKNYTAGEMVRQPAFWCFFLWTVLINSSGLLVINSAVPIAAAFGA